MSQRGRDENTRDTKTELRRPSKRAKKGVCGTAPRGSHGGRFSACSQHHYRHTRHFLPLRRPRKPLRFRGARRVRWRRSRGRGEGRPFGLGGGEGRHRRRLPLPAVLAVEQSTSQPSPKGSVSPRRSPKPTSQNPLLGSKLFRRRGARQGGEEGAGLAGHEQLAYLGVQNGGCCKDTRGREAERVGRLARGKALDKADVEAVPADVSAHWLGPAGGGGVLGGAEGAR